MTTEQGTVVEVHDGTAVVRTEALSECDRCTMAGSCCTFSGKSRTVEVADPLGVRPGQRVSMSVRGPAALAAVGLLYGLPVAALVLGAVAGPVVAAAAGSSVSTDVAAVLGAMALLCCALIYARIADRRFRSDPSFGARITAVVRTEQPERERNNE